jgi:transcriptional regulator with XRE-family HTH domain
MSGEQLTLQDLRKRTFKTIKDFAAACGFSSSKASMLLQGRYHMTLSRDEAQHLSEVLGVTFDACVSAANSSWDEWCVKEKRHGPSKDYWDLRTRWAREDQWEEEVRQWKARGGTDRIIFALESLEALAPFALPPSATKEDVLKAFREKVKSMADGKGGYTGDMDALVQSKEKALASITNKRQS